MDTSSGEWPLNVNQETSKNQKVVYVGIEVDDVSCHASALGRHTGEVLDFRCSGIWRSVAIAVRCLQRLNKKGNRLLLAGKHPNRVKVACASERVSFVWESLNQVAAAQLSRVGVFAALLV